MAKLTEPNQTGAIESWEELVALADVAETPFTSMVRKSSKPTDVLHHWQAKKYPKVGHQGAPDKDADDFNTVPRARLKTYVQRTWRNPAVGYFAQNVVKLHGGIADEMASQIADAITLVKRQIEQRCLSNSEMRASADANIGYETRGVAQWISNGAQSVEPVPEDYRPASANIYTGTVADFDQDQFMTMAASAYKERNGRKRLMGFVGIDLKQQIDKWSAVYPAQGGSDGLVRSLNSDQSAKDYIQVVDRVEVSAATVDLHCSSFMYTGEEDGADSANTHRSGFFLDMDMWRMNYSSEPSVLRLPEKGGGPKAVVDACFSLMCLNPLGHMKAEIAS